MTVAPAYQRMHTDPPDIPDLPWDLDCMLTKNSPRMRNRLAHSFVRLRTRLRTRDMGWEAPPDWHCDLEQILLAPEQSAAVY